MVHIENYSINQIGTEIKSKRTQKIIYNKNVFNNKNEIIEICFKNNHSQKHFDFKVDTDER